MDCKILIINASGSKQGEEKGKEISKKRRDVVHKVILDVSPDIILIQESHIALTKICTEELRDRNYQAIGPKGNGIIYDMDTFMYVEDPTTKLCQIHNDFELTLTKEERKKFFSRMCARILKGTEEDAQPTLFVCWHGPHIKSIDYKKKLYHNLCLLLNLYASEKQIQVILGGDFNLDLTKDKNLEANSIFPDELAVIDYMKLERRPNKIDYILTSPKIKVVDCKPVDVSSITKYFYPELTEPFVKAILDHDPIVVNVIIPNQEEVFPCLSELNLNESCQNGIEALRQFSKTQTRAYHEDSENLDQLLMTKPVQDFEHRYHLPYPRFPLNLYYNNYPPCPAPITPCKQYYPPYPWSTWSMPPKKTLFSLLSPYPSSMSMTLPNQYLDYYHPYQLLLTQPNQYDYYHLQSSKNVCFADIFYIDFWNPLVLYM